MNSYTGNIFGARNVAKRSRRSTIMNSFTVNAGRERLRPRPLPTGSAEMRLQIACVRKSFDCAGAAKPLLTLENRRREGPVTPPRLTANSSESRNRNGGSGKEVCTTDYENPKA